MSKKKYHTRDLTVHQNRQASWQTEDFWLKKPSMTTHSISLRFCEHFKVELFIEYFHHCAVFSETVRVRVCLGLRVTCNVYCIPLLFRYRNLVGFEGRETAIWLESKLRNRWTADKVADIWNENMHIISGIKVRYRQRKEPWRPPKSFIRASRHFPEIISVLVHVEFAHLQLDLLHHNVSHSPELETSDPHIYTLLAQVVGSRNGSSPKTITSLWIPWSSTSTEYS